MLDFFCKFAQHNCMKQFFRNIFDSVKRWLSRMTFRTGIIYLIVCLLFYIISFAQLLFPISASAKTALWITFFGLAKVAQYIGLAIVGAEGWRRIKAAIKRKKEPKERDTSEM